MGRGPLKAKLSVGLQRAAMRFPRVRKTLSGIWDRRAPGGFLVCHARRFMVVAVSKNASSTLAHLVAELEGVPIPETGTVHDAFGHVFDGHRRVSVATGRRDPRLSGYLRFAVYRDPIARWWSAYDNVAAERGRTQRQFYYERMGIIGASPQQFLEFTRRELNKPPLRQDEHLRLQVAYYRPDDVDWVVDMADLDAFLTAELGLAAGTENAAGPAPRDGREPALEPALRALYRPDFALCPNYVPDGRIAHPG